MKNPFRRKNEEIMRYRRVPTHKETVDERNKKWAHKQLIEKAKQDPILEARYINSLLGRQVLPETAADPAEEIKRGIDKIIQDATLTALKNDPKLADEMARKNLVKITGMKSSSGDGGQEMEFTQEGMDIFTQIEVVERLQEKFGGNKGGFLSSLATPENLGKIIDLVGQFAGGKNMGSMMGNPMLTAGQPPSLPAPRVYVVFIDGKHVEMDEEQYRAYVDSHNGNGKKEKPREEFTVNEGIETVEEKQKPIELSDWLPFMTEDNVVGFVDLLMESYKSGDVLTSQLIEILKTQDAQDIIDALQDYKVEPAYAPSVEMLSTKKEWLEKVQAMVVENMKKLEPEAEEKVEEKQAVP